MSKTELVTSGRKILIQAIGNPARGDDALGPCLIEALEARGFETKCAIEWVYQLQVEHAEQWSHFDLVILVDAHVNLNEDVRWTRLERNPSNDDLWGISSHQISPRAVLALNHQYFPRHPQVFQLALRAESFELGAAMSEVAEGSFKQGLSFLTGCLACDESMRAILA